VREAIRQLHLIVNLHNRLVSDWWAERASERARVHQGCHAPAVQAKRRATESMERGREGDRDTHSIHKRIERVWLGRATRVCHLQRCAQSKPRVDLGEPCVVQVQFSQLGSECDWRMLQNGARAPCRVE